MSYGNQRRILENSLIRYYNNYFPFEIFYEWLSYGQDKNFCFREFNFTSLDNTYNRYNFFDNVEQFKMAVFRKIPSKIDIGAIYNMIPRSKKREAIQHELLIDIDISDYDDTRTCCSHTNICEKCWKYLPIGCKILDAILREDYGFRHIMWVFSGRRGIHAWICDERARVLDAKIRWAIADNLQLVSNNANMKRRVILTDETIDYSTQRAINIIRPGFVKICIEEQDILGTNERISEFLASIPNDKMKSEIIQLFSQYDNSTLRWNAFLDYMQRHKESVEEPCHIVEEIMLRYMYPRIDMNVTRDKAHILKSPFSIHPKSKKTSIPFDLQEIDEFDISAVPTLDDIIREPKDFYGKQMLEKFNKSVEYLRLFVDNAKK